MVELKFKFNLSQKELCQIISVNRNTYKDYEIGNRTIPLQVLRDLATFYKVSFNYFFEACTIFLNLSKLSESSFLNLSESSASELNPK